MEGGTTDDEKLFPRFIKGLMVLFPHHNLVSKTEVKVRNWLLFNFFFKREKNLIDRWYRISFSLQNMYKNAKYS